MERTGLGVLVGVDGSEPSLRAADWAAALVAGTDVSLTICYVCDMPAVADVPLPDELRQDSRAYARRLVDRTVVRVRHAPGSVTATGRVAEGNPAAELLRLSADADQVVLGSRGAGGFDQLILGSVGAQVTAHAECPVVIVRGDRRDGRSVVVGIDGSPHGERALEYAFTYALRHVLPVHAVYAVRDYPVARPLPPIPPMAWIAPEDVRESAERRLSDAVGPWAAKFPAVPVESTVVFGSPAWALTEASKGAALVVVGSRGHGGFVGLLLGSVSLALMRHSACPVAVVR